MWLASSRTGQIIGQFLLPEPDDPLTGEQMLALLQAVEDEVDAVEDEVDGDARAASPDQPTTAARRPFLDSLVRYFSRWILP